MLTAWRDACNKFLRSPANDAIRIDITVWIIVPICTRKKDEFVSILCLVLFRVQYLSRILRFSLHFLQLSRTVLEPIIIWNKPKKRRKERRKIPVDLAFVLCSFPLTLYVNSVCMWMCTCKSANNLPLFCISLIHSFQSVWSVCKNKPTYVSVLHFSFNLLIYSTFVIRLVFFFFSLECRSITKSRCNEHFTLICSSKWFVFGIFVRFFT